jgi:hypothetical protein
MHRWPSCAFQPIGSVGGDKQTKFQGSRRLKLKQNVRVKVCKLLHASCVSKGGSTDGTIEIRISMFYKGPFVPIVAKVFSHLFFTSSTWFRRLMSSKRGRKRNDSLPPNRARDVQRAFRARRAAHLQVNLRFTNYPEIFFYIPCPLTSSHQALEERVAELEEENDYLRAALNLPPANRPPLGKGPTGKDKPKDSSGGSLHSLESPTHDSSDPASPSSTRTSSHSPVLLHVDVHPDSGTWNLMRQERTETHLSTPQSYLQPESPAVPQGTAPHSYAYSNNLPAQDSRHSMPPLYVNTSHTNYPEATDRNNTFLTLRESRNESHSPYPYSGHAYTTHDGSIHHQVSPTSHATHQTDNACFHRRSLTDSQAFRPVSHFTSLHGHSQTLARQAPRREHGCDYPSPSSPYGPPGGRFY